MELEDGSRFRGVAVAVSLLLLAVCAGCAGARHFALLENHGRALLIPPGAKLPRAGTAAVPDCPGEGATPLTPRSAHFARYGCYLQTGFVDLEAGMRLKLVKPVLAAGETALKTEVAAQQDLNLTVRSNVTGVETRYWEVRARQGGGVAVAETGFADGAARQYRLFFQARDLDRERKITLIGGATRAELDTATQNLESYCGSKTGARCLAMLPGMVIGAEIPVRVNGQAVYVPIGATVREALPRAGNASRIQLERLWRGRMRPVRVATSVPANASLLPGVPLNGGDSILW